MRNNKEILHTVRIGKKLILHQNMCFIDYNEITKDYQIHAQ